MACRAFLIVYCILQCIAFVLVLIGAPIDQFREKGVNVFGNKACLTFWGYKEKCYSLTYNRRPGSYFQNCKARKTRFQAAEALSIVSIALTLVAVIFGFVQLCCCRCFQWVCLVLNILSVASVCVCWACMVSEYYNSRGGDSVAAVATLQCGKLKSYNKYGAGFALYVTGWCLCLLNTLFIALPC